MWISRVGTNTGFLSLPLGYSLTLLDMGCPDEPKYYGSPAWYWSSGLWWVQILRSCLSSNYSVGLGKISFTEWWCDNVSQSSAEWLVWGGINFYESLMKKIFSWEQADSRDNLVYRSRGGKWFGALEELNCGWDTKLKGSMMYKSIEDWEYLYQLMFCVLFMVQIAL